MKAWKTRYGDNDIEVVNSAAKATLKVNGKTQDVFWGLFALQVRLFGFVQRNDSTQRIKVAMGSTFFAMHCAVFVDDEMVFSSDEAQKTIHREN